ncbi:MAG: GtrA family protein [Propionibacteriaceae bacterium]|jgi:putative flippase GtrA|nr:GtrA family protein [Propionibacteriaceae bacterium]
MAGLRDLYLRHRASLGQFTRFCLVGASGVLINLLVAYLCKKGAPLIWPQAQENAVLWDLPGTRFNIRWYHLFSMVAFLVANLCNYQLNRVWTFRDCGRGWFGQFIQFFSVGLLSQLIGMGVETALMNADSPIQLSSAIFDGSTGLRTKWYWAHLIMIMVTIPVSFLLNKFWTFRAARRRGES